MKHAVKLLYKTEVVSKSALKEYKLFGRAGCMGFRVHNKGPWIARIDGLDPKYGFSRDFQQADVDHAGVPNGSFIYRCWVLEEGPVYEVKEDGVNGKELRRYFLQWVDGDKRELSKDEVERWLNSKEGPGKTS